MDGAARPAGAEFFAGVELLEQRRQVLDDVLELDLDAVHAAVAAEAIPFEGVDHALGPRALDDQAQAVRLRALRRMPDMRRREEQPALADRPVRRPALPQQAP